MLRAFKMVERNPSEDSSVAGHLLIFALLQTSFMHPQATECFSLRISNTIGLSLSQEHCLRQNSLVACGSTIPTKSEQAASIIEGAANYCSSLRAADMFLVTKRSVVLRLKPMENLVNIILKQRRINGHHSKCSE